MKLELDRNKNDGQKIVNVYTQGANIVHLPNLAGWYRLLVNKGAKKFPVEKISGKIVQNKISTTITLSFLLS